MEKLRHMELRHMEKYYCMFGPTDSKEDSIDIQVQTLRDESNLVGNGGTIAETPIHKSGVPTVLC